MLDADPRVPDIQPGGTHLDGETCVGHAADRAKEYAATVHFLGRLAGISGTPDEQNKARALVKQVIEEFGVPTNLSSARDAEESTRRAYKKARDEHDMARIRGDAVRIPALEQAKEQAYAAHKQAYEHRTAVMHGSFKAFFENLWGSIKGMYEDAIAAIDNGTWKLGLCKLAVDAGFAVTEEGVALALTGLGLGAAALTLKISGRVVKSGSSAVTIIVRSQRNFLRKDSFDSSKPPFVEKDVIELDTSTVLRDEEKKLLGSDNQGTTTTDRDAGLAEAKSSDKKNAEEAKKNKEDEWEDGSYRNPDDPDGMRRTADGEAMIKNKHGEWKPVSDLRSDKEIELDEQQAAEGKKRTQANRHNNWKGQWGETLADRDAKDRGWTKINGDDAQITGEGFKGKGIDGIYKNPRHPPDYFVTDAKALGAELKKGQLTDEWIKDHLKTMVKKGEITNEQMEDIIDSNEALVQRVDKYGEVTLENKDKTPFREKE
ncbi:hypothetical protein [Pseudovibrio brasiliensis]|uniref:Uncharacterized protein n=1 Tax=Pseudovibrio brasiliensis TaxID=1898042 RepID=A0ABX8APX3_9HYPH|nr:hypothetical protein [Pseudovibrio brasiliensis]QUS57142.1 hypothetical protein KGB56_07060 [Pseudovibrio brasiliensis]